MLVYVDHTVIFVVGYERKEQINEKHLTARDMLLRLFKVFQQ